MKGTLFEILYNNVTTIIKIQVLRACANMFVANDAPKGDSVI